MVYPVDRAPISLDDLLHLDLEQQSKQGYLLVFSQKEVKKKYMSKLNWQQDSNISKADTTLELMNATKCRQTWTPIQQELI